MDQKSPIGFYSIVVYKFIYDKIILKDVIECFFQNQSIVNIVDYFNLSENRYKFVLLNHYHKIELTGNPALDEFIETNQY